MPNRQRQTQTDPYLLSMLVCPLTGGPLIYSSQKQQLFSRSAKLAFPIRDGIPILVVSEAIETTQAEFEKK